jgi:translocator protein
LINNVTSLIALGIVTNHAQRGVLRTAFIGSEAVSWVLFAIFTLLYFAMKSPILGAIDTALGFAFTSVSLLAGVRLNKRAALMILPRFLWLALATYVSIYVALYNADVFLGVGPFIR